MAGKVGTKDTSKGNLLVNSTGNLLHPVLKATVTDKATVICSFLYDHMES